MAQITDYIAVDLGAESGRVMLGSVGGGKVELKQVHRFGNGPIEQGGSLKWDFALQLAEVRTGIGKAAGQARGKPEGIGVDTWGVDFGLLGADGQLLENPYHYRDARTNGVMDKAFELMGRREIYARTGIQFMQLNSLYQLLSMRLADSRVLAKAKALLFVADLFSYHLCGKAFGEYTLASTSQMMDMRTGQWSPAIFEKLGLPLEIMPEIVQPGTIVGGLTPQVAGELGCARIPVIAVGSHDTASAVAAVPAKGGKWAYLSSGTWSLMGVEIPKAIINDKSYKYEFTNEGGAENTIRLLKNIMGLWLVQECKRQWEKEGADLPYADLTAMAEGAKPFSGYIDVDHNEFFAPGDMPQRVKKYLAETGQNKTDNKGQIVRIVLESLAFKYRQIMDAIEDVTGQEIDVLHIVGGGMQNELLCQFAANALNKRVVAGPIEATALGNVLMQAKATGQIKSLAEGRAIVRNSFELKQYTPQNVSEWQRRYEKTRGG